MRNKKEFNRLLAIPQGRTPQKVYDLCSELFLCWKSTSRNLDEVLDWSKEERDPREQSYAIRTRNRVETDNESKSFSAVDIQEKRILTMTLIERLTYELEYFVETGKHLDLNNVTRCLGSRFFDGGVPEVYCMIGKLFVYWGEPFNPKDDMLEFREVIIA